MGRHTSLKHAENASMVSPTFFAADLMTSVLVSCSTVAERDGCPTYAPEQCISTPTTFGHEQRILATAWWLTCISWSTHRQDFLVGHHAFPMCFHDLT